MNATDQSGALWKRWLIVITYVALLPYSYYPFQFLIDNLSLSIARWAPVALIAAGAAAALAYGLVTRPILKVATTVAICTACLAAAFAIQPNPIKSIHIPQYAILLALLFWANNCQNTTAWRIGLGLCLQATLFGIIDELHQGLHPERYFGWRDMLINCLGGIIGWVLLTSRYSPTNQPTPKPQPTSNQSTLEATKWLGLLLLNTLLLIAAIIHLLDIGQQPISNSGYPDILLMSQSSVFITSLLLLLSKPGKQTENPTTQILLIRPAIIAAGAHGVILFAVFSGIAFG